ncbi:MAG TPA: hypothetical protein VL418_10770 [Devosiaceae bacterium]|nr:hypothetical protein [Devosiaceae bacterium]
MLTRHMNLTDLQLRPAIGATALLIRAVGGVAPHEEKRATLASWASDARAVENAPALRRLDDGTLVSVDAILEALRHLDAIEDAGTRASRPIAERRRRPLRWRPKFRRHRRDDDDDPPPCPAAATLPRPVPILDGAAVAPAI